MSEPRLDYVMCASPAGLHRMAYWEWGDPGNDKVLMCVHGLTRTGRDFDTLAARLSSHFRVICPDVVGRGKSDWLINPASYVISQYVADMVVLIGRLRPATLDWLGTSMGGLIGLGLAGAITMSAAVRPDRGPFGLASDQTLRLGKMVFNDIGPRLDFQGLERIAEYVGTPIQFDSFDQAVGYVREVSAGFGPHTQKQWEDLTRYVFNQQGAHWVKHYDVRMAQAFAGQSPATMQAFETILWAAYESIVAPILVVKGELSDLLLEQTAQEMLARNSHAKLFEVTGVGHAPTLLSDDQIAPIEHFLLAG